MRTKKLKEVVDKAEVYNKINDLCIEGSLKRLESSEKMSKEEVRCEVENLRMSLDTRNKFNGVILNYTAQKEYNSGYAIGLGGALIGMVLGTVAVEILGKKVGK